MDKCELLAEVKDKMQKRGYVIGRYAVIDGEGNEQCCAVGYALETLGMAGNEICDLKGFGVDDLYTRPGILKTPYFNHVSINRANYLLTHSELTVKDYKRMQTANDSSNGDMSVVVGVIDRIMSENKC